ncbi:hypothetical protein [Streptomyces sp. NPDC012746]|uniref:hypothetical protein n=1 Tax=Streptomyces sp. NPDC012746 TaxID=3364845 RepID=UPI003679289E
MIKDIRKRKDVEHRYRTRLEMAALEVQFIEKWMQVRRTLGDSSASTQQADLWLERCYRSAEEVGRTSPTKRQLSRLRRLLLVQPLAGSTAQIARLAYWVAFAVLNVLTALGLRTAVQWLAPGGKQAYVGEILSGALIIVGFAVFTAGLRNWALTMDAEARRSL